jgi:hypothetical protein
MLDLSAKFTKLVTAPGIDESLCPRCKLIDFVVIFERPGDELNGTIIANIGLRSPNFQTLTVDFVLSCSSSQTIPQSASPLKSAVGDFVHSTA